MGSIQNRPDGLNEFDIELNAIREAVSSINGRLSKLGTLSGPNGRCAATAQGTDQILYEDFMVRLDCLEQSIIVDHRLSALEALQRRRA
jgi:hypothetical protein